MSLFTGACVAMVTPFNETGIDFECFSAQIDYYLSGHVSAVCVLGTTGEPTTMTQEEKDSAIKFVVNKINKRVPVIVGCGSNSTMQAINNAQNAQRLGADALLVVTPYYNKCTQKGLIEHYSAIANSVNIPIIVYNVPVRTGVNLLPTTMLELTKIKNIIGIKEASGNVDQLQELLRICDDKTDVYLGEDALAFIGYSLGAKGVISVVANVAPALISKLCADCEKGDFISGRSIQFALRPLIKNLFCEVNPIPVKKAMEFLGFNVGNPRLPLTPMEFDNAINLKKSMLELELIRK